MSRLLKGILWLLRLFARVSTGTIMGIYRFLERVAYTLSLIVCLIYFGLSDPEVAQFVAKGISAGIPGTITFERMYASPLLRHFTFKEVQAFDPKGKKVIHAHHMEAWVNRKQLVPFITRRIAGERIVLLNFDRAFIQGGWVEVDVRGEGLPIEETFSERFMKAGDLPTDGYLRITRAQVRDVDLAIRSSSADIDINKADVDATIDLIASDARVLAHSIKADSGEVRLVAQPNMPRFPFTDAQFHRVYNTNDRVEFGGFTLNTSGILITGQGRLGHDSDRAVQAVIRADSRMDDPLVRQLLPKELKISGTGLAAAVARIEGSLQVPVVHLDLYAEDAQVNDLEIRQLSGQSILEPETDKTLSWLYTIPRMRVRTQHGSAEVKGVHGAYSFREYSGFRGSADIRFRRFAATKFGLASGLIRPKDGESEPIDVLLNGSVKSDFGYIDKTWRASAYLSMNNVLEGSRRLRFDGLSLMTYADEELTLLPQGVTIEDQHMKLGLTGSLALTEGEAGLKITGTVHSLKDLPLPFAEFPANGQLRHVNLQIDGPLPFPTYDLECHVKNIRTGPILPLEGRTKLKMGPDGILHILSMNVDGEAGQAKAQGTLHLLKPGLYQTREKPVLNFRLLKAKLALHSHFGTQTANGYLHVDGRGLKLNVAEPVESLYGRFNIQGQHINARGVRIKSLNLRGRSGTKRIRIEDFEAQLERGGNVKGSGQILKKAQAVNLSLKGEGLNLEALGDLDHKRRSAEEIVHGTINSTLRITGSVSRPRLQGSVEALEISRKRLFVDRALLRLIPLSTGGARLESEVLPDGYLLAEPSEVRLEPHRKVVNLTLAMHGADPLDLFKPANPDAPNYKTEQIKLRGEAKVLWSTGRRKKDKRTKVSLRIPPLGFELKSEELIDPVRNTAPIKAELVEGDLWVPNLQLKMSDAHIEGCGVLRKSGDLKLATRGEIPLTMLTTFRTVVSEGEGRAIIGGTQASVFPPELRGRCNKSLSQNQGSVFTIDGPVQQPVVDGEVIFKQGMLKLTGLPEQIRFPDDWGLLVRTRTDQENQPVEILTKSASVNVLNIGEGNAEIDGVLQLKGFYPETLDMVLKGQGIGYTSQNVSNMSLRTSDEKEPLIIEGRFLSDPEKRSLVTRGHVRITEGRYTRSFDALSRTVGGVFGRRMDMFSRPITETFPVLANMGLNMQVESTSFRVESPFPLGEAKLDLDMNLAVGGTLGKPAMNGLVGIRPQSTITYAFGQGRTFSITQGVIEFQGDTEHPYIDLSAESEITYAQTTDEDVSNRTQSLDFEEEETVVVTIRIEGRYPDLDIYFESDRPEFDTADIQSLILVGVPASRDSSNLDPLADTTLNFFTEDLSKALSSLLLTPFIDSVNLGIDQYGGLSAEVLAQLGRFLNVRAKIIRVGTDTRYDTGFQVKIREGVYLEGKLKVLQQEQDQTQSYEAKLKYRIPLDD